MATARVGYPPRRAWSRQSAGGAEPETNAAAVFVTLELHDGVHQLALEGNANDAVGVGVEAMLRA
jgi:hypothetical protein